MPSDHETAREQRVEALTKVLAEHVALRYDYTLTPTVFRCTCGEWQPENEEAGQKSHHQHVAAVIADAMRDLLAEAKADALREAARTFREEAAREWGGAWMTTGEKVASLAALWCEELADDMETEDESDD